MKNSTDGAVLIVCADEKYAAELTSRFYDEGVSVIGPVGSASMALALTAITLPKHAILAGPTEGRRDVATLAEELLRTWGVESTIVQTTEPDGGLAAAA